MRQCANINSVPASTGHSINPPSETTPGRGGSAPSPAPSLLSLLTSSQWLSCPLPHCQEVRQSRARLTSHLLHHTEVLDLLEAATPQAEVYSCTSRGPGLCFPVWAGRTQYLLHRFMNCTRGAKGGVQ